MAHKPESEVVKPATAPRSPRPAHTEDLSAHIRIKKRIVVCCDGTWQDGIVIKERWKYTNVIRLARAIKHTDNRTNPPIPQIVFYQSGIGTDEGLKSRLVDGATGVTLADKVQEAYAFIAHNYEPGDEIFLFGFSRGAYTARMVAQFLGQIGALDSQDMDYFAEIFIAFQKRGKTDDPEEIAALDRKLQPWTRPDAAGKKRVNFNENLFAVKVVGVFDTVGSLGLPEELAITSDVMKTIFGFNDRKLGDYIERAYHAMAINEMRGDFDICKFEQTDIGRQKGQLLKQHWFAGAHSDIGGGYEEHDLSDITLSWMAANVGDVLLLDMRYLASRPQPVAPYGQLPPHDSKIGVYALGRTNQRKLPTVTNQVTHEMIHPSVLRQARIQPEELKATLKQNPKIVSSMLPLEIEVERTWPYDVAKANAAKIAKEKPHEKHKEDEQGTLHSTKEALLKIGGKAMDKLTKSERARTEGGEPVYDDNWLSRMSTQSSVGPFVKEFGH